MTFGKFGGQGRGMLPLEKATKTSDTVMRIWSYLARQRYGLIAVACMVVVASLLTLTAPYILGVAIDDYVIPGQFEGFLQICIILACVYAGSSLMTWLHGYLMVGLSHKTVQTMREDVFAKLQKLPLRFFDNRTHGEIMSRATNDIEQVSTVLNQSVTQLISSFVIIIGSFLFMISLNPRLTLISLIIIPIVIVSTKLLAKYTRRFFTQQQRCLGDINGFIEETIAGQKVVKIFNQEDAKKEQFQNKNQQLKDVSMKAQIFAGIMPPLMNAITNMSFAMITVVGAWMVISEMTSIGVVVSFLHYSKQFSRPVNELANQFNLMQAGVAGAERVFEIIDSQSEYETARLDVNVYAPKTAIGEIRFEHVSFSYTTDVPILENITFKAKPGETIALVGPTGAGKTTIISLLTRFYEITDGRINIDGVDIQSVEKDWLRSQIGMVLQDVYLFAGTIKENIRYGRLEATDEEVVEAAKLVNAHTFIQRLPQGYDTVLTSEGSNLSQGQRQLINIARAILANPVILILDEATSSIDTRTELMIQKGIDSLKSGRTSLVIAHRLSTIREADKILVMYNGRIAEQGNHEHLIRERGLYYTLYNNQYAV
ncbi:multidrug ABC transporter ATP-binding protein [Desulfuribacillus alkaliarsenatis]|uniref:Multidrug ABC transporter ATP-binding protein n=2 Tax=Desulfuribacillus alkaliarsenatis TaxID=766136 RepID=A0A1E5G3D8_9FIRM|nr:multidrug ABC transporter ATP-binding protein [Desulfuribacillus alkaliarsenatis]